MIDQYSTIDVLEEGERRAEGGMRMSDSRDKKKAQHETTREQESKGGFVRG